MAPASTRPPVHLHLADRKVFYTLSEGVRRCDNCGCEYPDDGHGCPQCGLYPPTPSPSEEIPPDAS